MEAKDYCHRGWMLTSIFGNEEAELKDKRKRDKNSAKVLKSI